MNIRTKISDKSPYYIGKERYLELKHFCLQYRSWKVDADLIEYATSKSVIELNDDIKDFSDNVFEFIAKRSYYLDRVKMVDDAIAAADPSKDIQKALLECVTTGKSYAQINARHRIPCGRSQFYTVYRRFFYILSQKR